MLSDGRTQQGMESMINLRHARKKSPPGTTPLVLQIRPPSRSHQHRHPFEGGGAAAGIDYCLEDGVHLRVEHQRRPAADLAGDDLDVLQCAGFPLHRHPLVGREACAGDIGPVHQNRVAIGDTAVEAYHLVDEGVVLALATAPDSQVDGFTVLQDPACVHQSRIDVEAGLLLGCEVHMGPPSARKSFR